jgi:predicted ester cyclase
MCGPEVEWEVPGAPVLRERDQVLPYFSSFWEAFPDLRLTVTSVVEEGSVVAIQGSAAGTHRGTLRTLQGAIPPTGGPWTPRSRRTTRSKEV